MPFEFCCLHQKSLSKPLVLAGIFLLFGANYAIVIGNGVRTEWPHHRGDSYVDLYSAGLSGRGASWSSYLVRECNEHRDRTEKIMLHHGLYEQVINHQLASELAEIPEDRKATASIGEDDAPRYLHSIWQV